MDIRVGSLRPGARLVFGKHSLRDHPDTDGIVWLKLERDGGKFITESVIDLLFYDSDEPRNPDADGRFGTKEYELSNLCQYLNAVETADWWRPSHPFDEPPRDNPNRYGARIRTYVDRPGFLSEFEDYELAVLNGDITIPTFAKITGDGAEKYALFRKKGIRAHPTQQAIWQYRDWGPWGCDLQSTTGYAPYWVLDARGIPGSLTRSGYLHGRYSRNAMTGVRPICDINPNALVDVRDDGVYVIRPVEAAPIVTATDEDIMLMLGLS